MIRLRAGAGGPGAASQSKGYERDQHDTVDGPAEGAVPEQVHGFAGYEQRDDDGPLGDA